MEALNKLRKQLESKELIVAPGAWDGISARLIEQAGFPVAYMTGAGVAAANGYPDFGLVTLTEMTAASADLDPFGVDSCYRRRGHGFRERPECAPYGPGI
ncbi:isocitrate lyase/phosphoenolpyruvate mutase family protein [Paraburkholderia strydomiana]